jgi:hypothetical protein
MTRPHRQKTDTLPLWLSASNLPGTLFVLILLMCACLFALSKGVSFLLEASAAEQGNNPSDSYSSAYIVIPAPPEAAPEQITH